MTADIQYGHHAASWLIGFSVILAAIVIGFAYYRFLPGRWRNYVPGFLKLGFLLLLTWCLLMPYLRSVTVDRCKPRFLIAVDRSASMRMSPEEGAADRWDVVKTLLAEPWTRTLEARCDVDVFDFSSELGRKRPLSEVVDSEPDHPATHLRQSLDTLRERYIGQPVLGMLVLSDGLDTREANQDWAEAQDSIPIYTVRLDDEEAWKADPDARVDMVDTSHRVTVDWDSSLTAVVSGQGLQGDALRVQLWKDEVLQQEIPTRLPADNASRSVEFRVPHPEVGAFTYTVRIPVLPNEAFTNDNQFSVSVDVVDAKNRLLYLEGYPRWESKYLTRVLRSSRDLEPLCFLQGPGGRLLTIGERESLDPDLAMQDLKRYRIVILGDLEADVLGPERSDALVEFVDKGGSLVLLGGASGWGRDGFESTSLSKLLPLRADGGLSLEEGRFQVRFTREGLGHAAFQDENQSWETVPPILSVFTGGSAGPGTRILVETKADSGVGPLVGEMRYGQGVVLAVMTDSLWRWQLDPSTLGAYQSFWKQILYWLTPDEEALDAFELDLFADSGRIYLGDTLELNARIGVAQGDRIPDVEVVCEIVGPEGRTLQFDMAPQPVTTTGGETLPGYGMPFEARTPGLYKARAKADHEGEEIVSAPYSFYVKPFTPETLPRPADNELLKTLAESNAGRFMEPEEVGDVLLALEVKAQDREEVTFASLWNTFPVLLTLIALLTGEWVLRKIQNLA